MEQEYELAASLEETVWEQLKQAKTAHFDETGLRIGGKLGWLHAACNEQYMHLFVHEKRGEAALRSAASVLKDFQGYAIHDSWASYFKFTGRQHGLCNAHIVRELQGLVEAGSSWAEQMRAFLLELLRKCVPCPNPQRNRRVSGIAGYFPKRNWKNRRRKRGKDAPRTRRDAICFAV